MTIEGALCSIAPTVSDWGQIEIILSDAVKQASSLEDFVQWLESQDCIQSVDLTDYLVKTCPPLRELNVVLLMEDKSLCQKIIDVAVLADHSLQFHKLRER
jgi:hypothetical protein